MWKPIILDVECIVCNKSLQKINHDPHEIRRKMGKISCRRSRTPNWSVEEKKYLLELIKNRKEVVVTKHNNGPNYSEEKDMAWNEILRELNARFGDKFSGSSIKKVKTQWQNMKRIAREEINLVGPNMEKFTKTTLEVCTILDMIKDGVFRREDENFNETINISTNVEIKTERLDEDLAEPSCSGLDLSSQNKSISSIYSMDTVELVQKSKACNSSIVSESSASTSESNEMETQEDLSVDTEPMKKDVAAMTEGWFNNITNLNSFQDLFKYSSDEKMLKMESLKEERRVVRAMRETAELNKIIAEQKLKHVLWLKKQEME